MNNFDMELLGRLTHEERIRQGKEERLAIRAMESWSRGRRRWAEGLLFLFLQG